MMNSKAKGTAWENLVKHYLERKGMYVIRAAGSMGDYDLIAIEEGEWAVYGVQCKTSKGLLDLKSRERLRLLGLRYGIIPKLAYPLYGPNSKKADNIVMEAI